MTDDHTGIPGEAEFWTARTINTRIYLASLDAMCSPWAVFGQAVARTRALVPPTVRLPAAVGGRQGGSLNVIIAVAAVSGGGKGLSGGVAEDIIPLPGSIPTLPLGSGEGLGAAYFEWATGEKGGGRWQRRQNTAAALFSATEIDSLSAVAHRNGSTVTSQIRAAFSGEQLGFQNADPRKRFIVEPHTYRFVAAIYAQPSRLGGLLDEADGGTPQRILWMPGHDPRIDEHANYDVPTVSVDVASTIKPIANTVHHIKIPDEVRQYIRAGVAAANRGERADMDSHAVFVREKVALVLALWDNRTHIDLDDWELAGIASAVSAHTRDHAMVAVEAAAREAAERRGAQRGIERHATDVYAEAAAQETSDKAAKWLRTTLINADPGGISHTALLHACANSYRPAVRQLLVAWAGNRITAAGTRPEHYWWKGD